MCWHCVTESGGDEVVLTDDMKRLSNLIWDWYHAPDENEYGQINGSGGSLHVQLDDHNLEDEHLTDDWNLRTVEWGKNSGWVPCEPRPYNNYSPETFELGQIIVERLRDYNEAERNAIVYHADVYQSEKPFYNL